MSGPRRTSSDELARAIARVSRKVTQVEKPTFKGSQDSGLNPDDALDNAFANPMSAPGDMIFGAESGAPVRLATPTSADLVLTSTSDGDGGFKPSWAEASGSPGSGGQYRQYLVVDDGSGGWGFVQATVGGLTRPVTGLFDLE